jgi:hypothetical protein
MTRRYYSALCLSNPKPKSDRRITRTNTKRLFVKVLAFRGSFIRACLDRPWAHPYTPSLALAVFACKTTLRSNIYRVFSSRFTGELNA